MIATRTLSNTWMKDCELLQCPDCGGRLEPAASESQEGMACLACPRAFPIRDGKLVMLRPLEGNNKVAADFYNGPLWPRFRFWEWFTFLFNGGERRARRQIMKYLPNLSGTRLLEVAIGDGANVPLIPTDCQVYGNDISTVQLTNCRRKHPDRELRLFLGEAENLPFRDHSFDNVLSVGAFNYFNDPVKSLKEMARVVKPGGLVVVSDEVPNSAESHDRPLDRTTQARSLGHVALPQSRAGVRRHGGQAPSPPARTDRPRGADGLANSFAVVHGRILYRRATQTIVGQAFQPDRQAGKPDLRGLPCAFPSSS